MAVLYDLNMTTQACSSGVIGVNRVTSSTIEGLFLGLYRGYVGLYWAI